MRFGMVAPMGAVSCRVMRAGSMSSVPNRALSFWEVLKYGFPHFWLSREVALWRLKNLPNLMRGLWRVVVADVMGIATHYGQVSLVKIAANGRVVDYGLASLRVVTDTGVGFIVDGFQNLVELENMKYHGLGTGSTAEAASQTALVTELTTQYNPDSTRATGTTTENGASTYRTVGTNTVDAAAAVTEHGIFSQAATGGGVMLDRSVFSAINLANGDSLQTTYDLVFTSGS